MREIQAVETRRRQFVRAFRTLLERYLSELEVEEVRLSESAGAPPPIPPGPAAAPTVPEEPTAEEAPADAEPEPTRPAEDATSREGEWLSSLVTESQDEEQT